jgi:A-macroglobulin TED domain/Prenyltransferase and squalene oxidase repeat
MAQIARNTPPAVSGRTEGAGSFARQLTVLLILLPSLALAQVKSPAVETLSPDLDQAIARGLNYLARQQQPDGSFQNRERTDDKNAPPKFTGQKIALTGLSLMAFLATGRMPDTGKHGLAVRHAIDFLVKSAPDDGYFGKVDGSRMYGHAIATIALAEVYGMEADAAQRKRVRTALVRAVKVLLTAQDAKKDEPFRGGWRYEIASADSDLSVSGWCILALRAAQNAGIDVPKDSADRAAAFVLRCWRPEDRGFAYQPGNPQATITMTASGVLDLYLLDRAARPEARRGAAFLAAHLVDDKTEYPYYARYYTTQAAFQAGGDLWPTLWNRTQADLLKLQADQKEKDGAWPPSRTSNEPGQTYATAMSVLTLAVPLRLLPTYQR